LIRRADERDIEGIHRLLRQVLDVHHTGRPDLFREKAEKYTDEELREILKDDARPIFVSVSDDGYVEGYAFCIHQQQVGDNILTDIKTLYIDDLCVDEGIRGSGTGRALYEYVRDYAKASGCYNVTLNVWALNEDALEFYRRMGLFFQKFGMEKLL